MRDLQCHVEIEKLLLFKLASIIIARKMHVHIIIITIAVFGSIGGIKLVFCSCLIVDCQRVANYSHRLLMELVVIL